MCEAENSRSYLKDRERRLDKAKIFHKIAWNNFEQLSWPERRRARSPEPKSEFAQSLSFHHPVFKGHF